VAAERERAQPNAQLIKANLAVRLGLELLDGWLRQTSLPVLHLVEKVSELFGAMWAMLGLHKAPVKIR
jgi:hypothetical protein